MACKNTAKEPFRHGRVRECFGSIAISIAIAALVRRTVTGKQRTKNAVSYQRSKELQSQDSINIERPPAGFEQRVWVSIAWVWNRFAETFSHSAARQQSQ